MDKATLRQHYLEIRDATDDTARQRASSLIQQKLFQHSIWREAESIVAYVSFRSEVDTRALIQEGIRFKKRMHVPIFDPLDGELTPISALHRWGDLVRNPRTQLLEPREDVREFVGLEGIHLVLVPGLTFDRQGFRIGFGGGYFDRLLSRMPQAKKVGLAFTSQLSREKVPTESHDVPMDFIFSDTETIQCK